ncbi:RIIA lysis inhibitor [Rhodococcus phage Trina]|uniref:RIIA-like protein n=1 Tax=Rhodococcus phage Trina TaxID=2027905 RepID=A0A2D0ZWR1_9CAUD|nr:RIIA lysis inhibitor [Rhodococcus phage Trina]ASZ74953.1 rIIA-like protein [Rhodococcus phage Trina]
MLVNTKDIRTEGSLGGEETIQMSLDANSLVHIMSVLADLYSDPAAAVIREYTTNALDSHIAAGQTRPVELSTPSRLSPYFIVQDYGLGMSVDDVRDVYSKFGASTKRFTNEQAGMLGLGSKSALTYCEQFTVRAVKDKYLSIISVSRSANGAGSIEIVDTRLTDEPNGVQIKIPVNRDHATFSSKIYQFAHYVTDPLLVDGVKVTTPNAIKLSDTITLHPTVNRYDRERDRIVMGNVSYPVEGAPLSQGRYKVLYKVPMGSVDFTPSREELLYSEITKATVKKMKEQFDKDFSAWVQSSIDNCKTYAEAWSKQNEINRQYNTRVKLKWQNKDLPDFYLDVKYCYFASDGKDVDFSTTSRSLTSVESTGLIITNWHNSRFARVQAEKINKYLAEKKLDFKKAILTDKVQFEELFTGWTIVDWNDIKKVKSAARVPRVGKPVKRWESYGNSALVEVDTSKDIYYASRTWLNGLGGESIAVSKTSDFYYVTDKETARFKKDYPKAVHMSEFARKAVKDYIASLTADDYDWFKHSIRFSNSSAVDIDNVLDPDLKKVLTYAKQRSEQTGRYTAYHKANQAHRKLSYADRNSAEFKLPEFEQTTGSRILDKYPLLSKPSFYSSEMKSNKLQEHMTAYVNMIYKRDNNII